MRSFIVVSVLFGMCSIGMGQYPIPVTPSYAVEPSEVPAAIPPVPQPPSGLHYYGAPASSGAPAPMLADSRAAKINHLRKAAEHLDAAGLHEDAKRIRGQADQEKAAVAGDIKALQAEIERLRSITQHPTQIMLKLRVIELSRSKLEKMGLDISKVIKDKTKDAVSTSLEQGKSPSRDRLGIGVLDANDSFFSMLDTLRKDRLAKVLAEPTLVTVSGRAASFQSGGEIPIPRPQGDGNAKSEYKFYGTSIDYVPILLVNQNIRLEMRACVSELDHANTVEIAGKTVPGIKTRTVDTGVEIQPGRTLVLSGLVHKQAQEKTETETLFLVTPEIVTALDPAKE
jgi:Flp pilus assembly secretin CpaC